MAASGSSDELRTAVVLLGASGVALAMTLRALCSLFRKHEEATGRKMSPAEIDALLAVASAHPVLEERLASVERALPAILSKLDDILARSSRRRLSDG